MDCDRTAMKFAIRTSPDIDRKTGPRIVWIKNTLSLTDFYISEALLEDAGTLDGMTVTGKAFEIPFDEEGNVDRSRL